MEYQTERIQTCQTKEKVTDQFYLNQDLNVPDAKPDVARVILASGKAVLEDVRFADHYVKGNIRPPVWKEGSRLRKWCIWRRQTAVWS